MATDVNLLTNLGSTDVHQGSAFVLPDTATDPIQLAGQYAQKNQRLREDKKTAVGQLQGELSFGNAWSKDLPLLAQKRAALIDDLSKMVAGGGNPYDPASPQWAERQRKLNDVMDSYQASIQHKNYFNEALKQYNANPDKYDKVETEKRLDAYNQLPFELRDQIDPTHPNGGLLVPKKEVWDRDADRLKVNSAIKNPDKTGQSFRDANGDIVTTEKEEYSPEFKKQTVNGWLNWVDPKTGTSNSEVLAERYNNRSEEDKERIKKAAVKNGFSSVLEQEAAEELPALNYKSSTSKLSNGKSDKKEDKSSWEEFKKSGDYDAGAEDIYNRFKKVGQGDLSVFNKVPIAKDTYTTGFLNGISVGVRYVNVEGTTKEEPNRITSAVYNDKTNKLVVYTEDGTSFETTTGKLYRDIANKHFEYEGKKRGAGYAKTFTRKANEDGVFNYREDGSENWGGGNTAPKEGATKQEKKTNKFGI